MKEKKLKELFLFTKPSNEGYHIKCGGIDFFGNKEDFGMIRLAASDIDGTLLQNGAREISEAVFEQILRLKKQGILFVAASGRQYKSLRQLFAPVADDILYLCENGAIVYQDGLVLVKFPMPRADAVALIELIQGTDDCEVLISGANTSYLMPKHEDYLNHIRYFVGNHVTMIESVEDIREEIIKVSAYCRSGAAAYDKPMGDPWRDRFHAALAGEKWLDFTLADKGKGMKALLQALKLTPEEVIAFGDNFNDLPMLEMAGTAYIIEGSPLDRAGSRMRRTKTVEDVLRLL